MNNLAGIVHDSPSQLFTFTLTRVIQNDMVMVTTLHMAPSVTDSLFHLLKGCLRCPSQNHSPVSSYGYVFHKLTSFT